MGLESGVRMGQMRSRTHTHADTHTHMQTHTDVRNIYTHMCTVTHEPTHTQIIAIITLAHAQAIIYSNIQLHMQESTPG